MTQNLHVYKLKPAALKEEIPTTNEDSDFSDVIPDFKFRPDIPRSGFGEFPELPHLSGSESYLLRNLLIGICSSLGFIMIVVVVCLLHRYRYRTFHSFKKRFGFNLSVNLNLFVMFRTSPSGTILLK